MSNLLGLSFPTLDYAPLEVILASPDDFLKVKETLTRIGIASERNNVLYQSCHILHKQGKYFIVHFKELFALDGKPTNLELQDLQRRNTIGKLLQDWGLVSIVPESFNQLSGLAPMRLIKVIPFSEKTQWNLQSKYTIGKKVRKTEY